jgi:hypothetical protein
MPSWRASLLDPLRSYDSDLNVPCCDRASLRFDLHRHEFADYRIAIPGASTISVLFDKERTRLLCGELGILVADGIRLSAGDSAQALAARFGLPLVLKPRKPYSLDRLNEEFGSVDISYMRA